MEILDDFSSLPQWGQLALMVFSALFLFFIGFKCGKFFKGIGNRQEKRNLLFEQQSFQKNLKKIYEGENKKLSEDHQHSLGKIELLEKRLEDYRRKISGMGILSFSGNQKRADILYSLLLENEALEQLLYAQGDSMLAQQKKHLEEKLMDIRKRQRLMAEIFNDQTIKSYISDILQERKPAENVQADNLHSNPMKNAIAGDQNTGIPEKYE